MNPGMFKENLLFIGKVVYTTEANFVGYFAYLFITIKAVDHKLFANE